MTMRTLDVKRQQRKARSRSAVALVLGPSPSCPLDVRGERNYRDQRRSARICLEPQLAAELSQTRSHSEDAHAETLRLASGGSVGDAFPVIADPYDQAPPGALRETRLTRHAMAVGAKPSQRRQNQCGE